MAEFIALADLLRPAALVPAAAAPVPAAVVAVRVRDDDVCLTVRDARRFRARLADAFDAALARMLRDMASDVLARELRLQSVDLAAIAARLRERMPVVRFRCASVDCRALQAAHADIVCAADDALLPGDLVIEVDGGECDLRLGVRLADIVDSAR